jgi:hypothetical protein
MVDESNAGAQAPEATASEAPVATEVASPTARVADPVAEVKTEAPVAPVQQLSVEDRVAKLEAQLTQLLPILDKHGINLPS